MTSLDLEKLKFLKRKFRILNFHKQCFPEMKIVFLRFGIQKQHFFHHPTKMPHTSKVAPLYGTTKYLDSPLLRGTVIWDILPVEVQKSGNMSDFKKSLNLHYKHYEDLL